MKKILIFLILVCLFGCTRYVMFNSIHGEYNKTQIDSILKIEKIPANLNNWETVSLVDYETNDSIFQYIFIKDLSENQIIYTLIKIDSIYNLNKRVVEKNKK